MRKILGYFLVTAGLALAQPTPTGIVKNGAIILLRAEQKDFVGAVTIDDTTSDAFAGGGLHRLITASGSIPKRQGPRRRSVPVSCL
jgi:hypothetical protein